MYACLYNEAKLNIQKDFSSGRRVELYGLTQEPFLRRLFFELIKNYFSKIKIMEGPRNINKTKYYLYLRKRIRGLYMYDLKYVEGANNI